MTFSNEDKFLHAKVAVVTGGGTGIGRAVALSLANRGAKIALLGRRIEPLREVAAKIEGDVIFRSVDVRDRNAQVAVFREIATVLGPPHILVANAGIGGPDVWAGEDRFDDIVRTNINGAYYSIRAFQSQMESGPDPRHIIVMSSCVARFGVAGIAGYSASKAGQLGLTRSLATELATDQVRVNAICPGWVDTEMAMDRMSELGEMENMTYEDQKKRLIGEVPLGRLTSPQEIAELVTFICSPWGASFTGQAFDPNDGQWMG